MKIDYYWERSWRVWVIMTLDEKENQIGEAQYAPNKASRDLIINQIKAEN